MQDVSEEESTVNTSSNSFNKDILWQACKDAIKKMDPRVQVRNPVMFIVVIGSIVTTAFLARDMMHGNAINFSFALQIIIWLWFTVLFANFADQLPKQRLLGIPHYFTFNLLGLKQRKPFHTYGRISRCFHWKPMVILYDIYCTHKSIVVVVPKNRFKQEEGKPR